MNTDPKYFFKYQARFSKKKEKIADLKVKVNGHEKVISDDKEKAKVLSDQYRSVWSNPKEEYIVDNIDKFLMVAYYVKENRHIYVRKIFSLIV